MGSGSGEPTVACRNKALGCSSLLANQKSEKRHAVRCKFKFKPADGNPASRRMSDMAPLNVCGFSPEDRKVWRQAIAMLIGLKIRNGFGEKDLAAAVRTALHRSANTGRNCEDCLLTGGVKVASGAASSGGPQGAEQSPRLDPWPFVRKPGWPPFFSQSLASRLHQSYHRRSKTHR
jgi:hypothetical protein